MIMRNKICCLLLVLLSIVIRSTSIDSLNRKGFSALDRKNYDDDYPEKDKLDYFDNDYPQQSIYRRNRYSPYGSPSNNYRSRSRWQSPYDGLDDYNDWSRPGYGLNGPLSPAAAAFDSSPFLNNGPICYSLLDSQYPLFSDMCGAVPQARYSLPNSFGHVERWQIAQILTAILGPATPACTRSLRLLLCPLLFPPCPKRYEAPPVLPCQPFCRAIKNQCASPSLDLLPCDLLPPTSDLCPFNPAPYSSLLSSFGQPLPFNGGRSPLLLPQSALSSILAQSALSPFDVSPSGYSSVPIPSGTPSPGFSSLLSSSGLPPSALASLLSSGAIPPSGISSPSAFNPLNNIDSYMADSLTPILVDFPPLTYTNDYQQVPRYFPVTRSATEKRKKTTLFKFTYDGSTLSIIIYIRQPISTSQPLTIQVQLSDSISHPLLVQVPTSFVGLLARCQSAKARLDYQWGVKTVYMDDYPLLLDAAATGLRITHSPSTAKDELNAFFNIRMPGACDEIANKITNLDSNVRSILLAQLQCN